MRPSVDEVNCSGTSRMLFSPASARARMRWYSRVVFPLPEPPKSSFNMMNLSVGSVFYRGSQKPLPLGEVSPKVTERASPA